jgi:hypothetical protein
MLHSSWAVRATSMFLGSLALLAIPSLAAGSDVASPLADAKVDQEAYTCEITAGGSYQAGTEGAVKITLVAKGDRHINKDYPHKFTATSPAPEGVTYPKPVLTKADGSFDEKQGSFVLPFTAAKAGKVKVGGTFRFSVCSDSQCLMEKVDLAVDVDVK